MEDDFPIDKTMTSISLPTPNEKERGRPNWQQKNKLP